MGCAFNYNFGRIRSKRWLSTLLYDAVGFFFLFDARPVANWCFIYLCAVTSPPWWVCVQHPVLEYNAVIYQAEL